MSKSETSKRVTDILLISKESIGRLIDLSKSVISEAEENLTFNEREKNKDYQDLLELKWKLQEALRNVGTLF
jgi:hypothetical protein